MPQQVTVKMAEISVSASPGDTLIALGLGSCIGLCLYDPVGKVAGLAHVVLPDSSAARKQEPDGKYADTAVKALIDRMVEKGALRMRIRAVIAGGAHVFTFGDASQQGGSRMDVGARNTQAVLDILKSLRIPVVEQDCGGSAGRTVNMSVDNGQVTVRTAGQPPVTLAVLGEVRKKALQKAA